MRKALLLGIVTAASEELARWLLETLAVTARKRLEAKRRAGKAKHFGTRR